MTLTFTSYDQSQAFRDFIQKVKLAQGFVSHAKYSKLSKATIELTAFVPEQPELLCQNENQNQCSHVHASPIKNA